LGVLPVLVFDAKNLCASGEISLIKIICLDEDGPFQLAVMREIGSPWSKIKLHDNEFLEFETLQPMYRFIRSHLLWAGEIVISGSLENE
jgi:hypothetical protein